MSFKEFNSAVNDLNSRSKNTLPPIGGDKKLPAGTKIKVKYFSTSVNDPDGLAVLESIMTKSMDSEGMLDAVGDIIIIREDTNFTKDGDYITAIKYVKLEKVDESVQVKPTTHTDDFDKKHAVKDAIAEVVEDMVNVPEPSNHDY